jgi:hypothetical protein
MPITNSCSDFGLFFIGFQFDDHKSDEVSEETSGDHTFLMLWTISIIYSPVNKFFLFVKL